MEGHPEEDDNGKYEDECNHPVLGLLRSQFNDSSVSLLGLLGVDVSVLEPVAASEVDGNGKNQRYAGHSEAQTVGA